MKKISIILIIFLLPLFTLAEGLSFRKVSENLYNDIFTSIINLLFTAAVVFFSWSVFRVVSSEGDSRDERKKEMFWGVIALFIMASVWGFVNILGETFFNENTSSLNGNGKEIFKRYEFNENDFNKYKSEVGGVKINK